MLLLHIAPTGGAGEFKEIFKNEMINMVFQKIVDAMEKNGNISKEDKEVYVYSLKTILVYLTNITLSLVIGLAMGMLCYCILFLAAFIILREEAGGYHAAGWIKCYVLSCFILVLTLFWIGTPMQYQLWITMILALLSAACIFIYAPLEDKNKPLDQNERIVIRKRAQIIAALETAGGLLLLAVNEKIAYAVLCSVIWCGGGYVAWFAKRRWSKK